MSSNDRGSTGERFPMIRAAPVWRSLLYVPAHVTRFVERAHTRGADCIKLDLEDSVPEAEKPRARAAIASAASSVRRAGADVLVRINAPIEMAVRDIEAAIGPDVDGIVVTKARGADHIHILSDWIETCEQRAGVPIGRTWLLPLVETPDALARAVEIARASARIVAISLGPEDFATAIGAEPTEANLLVPSHLLLHAARAAGVIPLGLLGTLAGYADLDAFRDLAARSRAAGFEGASCINPAQVGPLNDAFTPAPSDVAYARRVVDAATIAEADGRGAVALDGRMIDLPIVRRAEAVLRRADALASHAVSSSSSASSPPAD